MSKEDDLMTANNAIQLQAGINNKITLDQIACYLLKKNFILTALELHTEMAETGRELPRLRDFFSNPANFEQQTTVNSSHSANNSNSASSAGFFPLHKASSIQTFDSLDLTRYSDDADQNQTDKIAVLEFELRKAKETINQLRTTLTMATESNNSNNQSKSSLNQPNSSQLERFNDSDSNLHSKTPNNLINKNVDNFNILNDDEYEEDDYDYIETVNQNNTQNDTIKQQLTSSSKTNTKLMPHDKNAINFLINEYLLENSYKMTSITFSEENESQDLEDWDVIGLNRSKPPNLLQLYKNFMNKNNKKDASENGEKPTLEKKDSESSKCEISTQVEIEVSSMGTNTILVEHKDFECTINFDRDTFDNQRVQINKLLEKQEILLKSLSKLENEIGSLNTERESSLKKIDLLKISLDKANMTIKLLNEQELRNKSSSSQDKDDQNANNANSNENNQSDNIDDDSNIQELNEKKIPVVFKEILTKSLQVEYSENNRALIEETSKVKMDYQNLVQLLNKYLPQILPHVTSDKRIVIFIFSNNKTQFLPIIHTLAIFEQEDIMKHKTKKDCEMLRILFNLIENPTIEERSMILAVSIQFTKYVGPMYVNNYLLPLCWEQLNDKKTDEKRMLVAEACALLAPHIYNDIRSSLMFSILKQIIEEETCPLVRACAVKSLAILINYINDEKKFIQCIEVLDLCATDSSLEVVEQVEKMLMPCLSLWALSMKKLSEPLMNHLVDRASFHILNSNRQRNLVKKSPSTENDLTSNDLNDLSKSNKLPKLNSYFHSLQEKLELNNYDLYKIDSILEDYLSLTVKYLSLIESGSWTSADLADSFTWLSDTFLRKLIQMSAHVDAKDKLCSYFVNIFRSFTLLFAIDYELITSKIIPIFEKLLNIPTSEIENNQQTAIDQLIHAKSSPLFKSTLPVYFVGILSTLVDVEMNGWFSLNSDLVQDIISIKSESSPTKITSDKIINSSQYSTNKLKDKDAKTNIKSDSTSLEKRIDYMNNYLKNVFFSLSLNQANLDGLIAIYELMKLKSKTSDYVIQMLLSTLWDGIVHTSLYVRCNTAKLFEILVKDCDEYLLSTRILPALITLANDLDKMVRCSSISPLTSIIENCINREILERVYTQMQSFLSDPILKEDYMLQIELLKSFRRISIRVNSKFREELILPYLTIVTLQIKNVITENDYEFTMSAMTSTYLALTSSQIQLSNAIKSSSISSISSHNSVKTENQQNHQQDVIKICVLLFDNYQKLCISSFGTDDSSHSNQLYPIHLSRQSAKESILPGLLILKDIFHNKIIQNNMHYQNEFLLAIENMIYKIEHMQSESPNTNTTHRVLTENMSNSPIKASPVASNTSGLVSDLVSASVSSISTLSAATTSSDLTSNLHLPENNFKSLMFKGISNFNHSKDKLSNLLAQKNLKK